MSPARGTAAVLALCALAAAGCGLGPGDETGEVELTVTRDYGREQLVMATQEATESDTVMRLLDREAEIETRYGGLFVYSIDGLSGKSEDGRRFDWFYYVNGLWSPVGAADYEPSGGDRVWWDYRDWTSAMRVSAVVGSFPEPFEHGFAGEVWPVRIGCFTSASICERVRMELHDAGVDEVGSASLGSTSGAVRILVGPWEELRSDPAAALLGNGPERSGVFARFIGDEDPALLLLDEEGEATVPARRQSGLVAAVRPGDGPPTWLVTGTDDTGTSAAALAFGPQLRDSYAIAAVPDGVLVELPVAEA